MKDKDATSNSSFVFNFKYPRLSLSSMTSHVPLGDPKHGGALFLFPREIRDEIYRLLVKGSYLDIGCFNRILYPRTDVRPDFAILQVSKSIGREATEILYSESVFRFVLTTRTYGENILNPDLDRIKRLAPMIPNVIFDVYNSSMRDRILGTGDLWHAMNMAILAQDFGGLDIRRRSLLVRLLDCSKYGDGATRVSPVYQRLKAFVGFRAATVEVLPLESFLKPPPDSPSTIDAITCTKIKQRVTWITQTVAKELEPLLGPAVSGFRFDAGCSPLLGHNNLRARDPSLVGYLEFHPNKHTVDNQVVKEDQV